MNQEADANELLGCFYREVYRGKIPEDLRKLLDGRMRMYVGSLNTDLSNGGSPKPYAHRFYEGIEREETGQGAPELSELSRHINRFEGIVQKLSQEKSPTVESVPEAIRSVFESEAKYSECRAYIKTWERILRERFSSMNPPDFEVNAVFGEDKKSITGYF